MTMKLTGPKTVKPADVTFGDLAQGDCFTTHRDRGSTVYQKLDQEGALNATGIAYGNTVCFKGMIAVYRVTVDATWRWADD